MSGKKFNKSMSSMDILFLAMGAMLGWGWVVLSGEWVADAGFLGAIVAFLIGGTLVTLIGLTYAELAAAIPETGGGVVFVERAFKYRPLAFIAGWSVLFGYVSVITFEAVALPTVLDYIIDVEHIGYLWTLGDPDQEAGAEVYLSWALIGSVGALLLGLLNYFGIKPAAIFQTIFTITVVIVGFILVYGAVTNGTQEYLSPPFRNGIGGTMSVMIMIPFLFVGFDVIPQVAAEVNAPAKAIGRIIIISIVTSVLFYLLIVYGVTVGLAPERLKDSALATAEAMSTLFNNPIYGKILVVGGVAGIITSWNAFIIGGSRVLYAMAIRNMVPRWFGVIHPRYNTPTNAVIFLAGLAFFAPFLGRPALVWIVNAGGIGIVIGYLIVTLAFMKLRQSEPTLARPYSIKYPKVIGISAIILSISFIALYMPGMPSALQFPIEWSIVFGWYILGILLFVLNQLFLKQK